MTSPETYLKPAGRRVVSCLALIMLGACTPGPARLGGQLPLEPMSAIFSSDQTRELFHRLGRCDGIPFDSLDGAWTPTAGEVEPLKPRLHQMVDARRSTSLIAGRDYSLQFFGIVVAGRRLIYVNAVHTTLLARMTRDPGREWLGMPIVICDAGTGAYQVEYDVVAGEFGEIRFSSTYGGAVQP